ncbi:MAG TPA: VIT and VWA domain-containing protein [Candidatus Binatia bacterium]|nr:VIT and VWA domain-containing protein [Candidatus Binatia bacterium]
MIKVSVWFLSVLFVGVFAALTTRAEEPPSARTLSPYFFIENADQTVDRFPLKDTNVEVDISGVIADVVIRQTYSNDGTRPISGRYIFPLSTRAAVHGMKMTIGNNVIIAKIKEREAAQKEFQEAQSQGKSASLLQQQRPNVFSMNVANILPGDNVEIELRYTEILVPTDKTYEFVYPTVVGPRYSSQPPEGAAETDQWVKSPYLAEGTEPPTKFNITTRLSTGVPLQEIAVTSHDTDILQENATRATVALIDPDTFSGNRDYILKFRLAGDEIQSGLMVYQGDDENFFLLMVQPPRKVLPALIPPREYIFVVDVSGSMHGFPLEVSKTLLKDLIGNLRPTDKFNVVLFSGASRVMAPASVPATDGNVTRAIRLIDSQQGGGGTELLGALKQAYAIPRAETFSRTILVVTDGFIAAERAALEEIRSHLHDTNVFAFGIGSSVNRYLIEGVAIAGQGEPFVVSDSTEAPDAARRFREYVQSPMLKNIALSYAGFDAYDVEPAEIPDLFANRPIVVFGKWRGASSGAVTVSGNAGNGVYTQRFNMADAQSSDADHALRYLWARTRIARLSDYMFDGNADTNKPAVTALGLQYNLLTPYTSFIAVHEVVRNPGGDSEEVDQPRPLPLYVSNLAVSAVPEPEMTLLVAITLLLFYSMMLRRKWMAYFERHRR